MNHVGQDPSHITISKRRAYACSYNDRIMDGAIHERWEAAKRQGWRETLTRSDRQSARLHQHHNGATFYLTYIGFSALKP